ncbi:hypothetical protein RclHR1_03840008 [Rhizophagus clarus]|uniref:Uncharacterized protein n=1 Tax=Rhizophagus clarus TaxID=94130 RepID=A0A2Z6RCX4_9GLOM|nr:hypothetical protein RclHR1_03840008 [Rhizophagus clarus]GES96417.1 hypothetical protein GLOIN_2v1772536 [Rhizophagus clarus]
MENNNLSQNEFLNETDLTELINDFYNYYGNVSDIQPQAADIQTQNSSLNMNSNNTCDLINELFAMNDEDYLNFDCTPPISDQNYQQSPITTNEQFMSNFISTSNQCLPQSPQSPHSILTQSIPENFSYTFNTITVDSLQTNTSNTCEIFKFEYRVITTVPATYSNSSITPITATSNIIEMRQQLNYFSSTNSNLQIQSHR